MPAGRLAGFSFTMPIKVDNILVNFLKRSKTMFYAFIQSSASHSNNVYCIHLPIILNHMPKRASSQLHGSRSKKTKKRLAIKYARKAAQTKKGRKK